MSSDISIWTKIFGNRDMTNCHKALRLVQAAIDGELDDATLARVNAHLAACRKCGMTADTYRAIKASIATRGNTQLDPAILAELTEFARNLTQR